jgi:hypothetical protein
MDDIECLDFARPPSSKTACNPGIVHDEAIVVEDDLCRKAGSILARPLQPDPTTGAIRACGCLPLVPGRLDASVRVRRA